MSRTWEVEPTGCALSERIRQEATRSLQMGSGRKLKVASLNEHLICALCSGYLIEAVSIVECWHTFCRSCITKYLQVNKNKEFCPRCDVRIEHLRPDKTMQDIVYKLVPGLYQNEMRRRRDFYSKHQGEIDAEGEGRGVLDHGARFFSQDDSISLSLEYYNSEDAEERENDQKFSNGKPKRYLQCPAAVTVRHLKKFLRMKYGIGTDYRVDIIYQDECLPEEFSLIDVAYTFAWRRTSPMRFSYRIFTKTSVKTVAPQKSLKTTSTVKNNRRNNPKNQSSLEQQRQNEYLVNFNLNPTNSGFLKNQNRNNNNLFNELKSKREDPHRYQDSQDSEDASQEKVFPSSEESNASGLRIISEKEESLKENSEESQEFNIPEVKKRESLMNFGEDAEDGFAMKKLLKSKHKSEVKKEKKKHEDVFLGKKRRNTSYLEEVGEKKKSVKRRKSMIDNYSEVFERKVKEEDEEVGKLKNEALRKVFVCKDKPEVVVKRKDDEVRRKKRKKSKHHEGEAKKRKQEIISASPSILSFAKDPLKLKVKLTPNKPITVQPVEEVEKVSECKMEEVDSDKDMEKDKKVVDDGKKQITDKERLLHLRAVRHKNIVNKTNPKDYINAPPSLTISKIDSSDQQPVKSTLVESRPSLEIMLVNSSDKNRKVEPAKAPGSPKTEKDAKTSEAVDTFGVLDLSEKSTRTKDVSKSPSPKDITEIVEKKKSTQQSILQIAQTLVSRKLSPTLSDNRTTVADHAAAMRNLMTLSDTAVNILMAAQSQSFTNPESPKRFPTGCSSPNKSLTPPNSTKSTENASGLKIPFYPLVARDRPNPIPPIPNLHEIPRGRGRSTSLMNRPTIPVIKPGQNQTVRQIPNPSVVSSRQSNQFQNLIRPSIPVLKPPTTSPTPKTENGDLNHSPKHNVNNKINSIPPLQSIKTKFPVPKIDDNDVINNDKNSSNDNNATNPAVPKTINNNNSNANNNNNINIKAVQNGSEKSLFPIKNGDDFKKINAKLNNSNSIRRIENMTRNIESVAAGLTARAVSNAMIDAK